MKTKAMVFTKNGWQAVREKLRHYGALIKSLQTILLLITGLAGFMSSQCPWLNHSAVLKMSGSMFLSISGSTVLNMWYDRDIDAKMERTCRRPLPSGLVSPKEGLILGLVLSIIGIGWAFSLDMLYGSIIFAGLFFDVVVYTIWLKRRTAWSIVWGGISGGMPILAGRAYGLGEIDWIGATLALAILCWIPTHIMTTNISHYQDYQRAKIPTFPSRYGVEGARQFIAGSSIMAVFSIVLATVGMQIPIECFSMILMLSFGLLLLAFIGIMNPTAKANRGLFKYASIYMLSTMLLLVAGLH